MLNKLKINYTDFFIFTFIIIMTSNHFNYNTFMTAGLSSSIGIVISHPIDTIKTLNQVSIKQTSNRINIKLFNGLIYPLKSNFILNGTVFYLHEYFYNIIYNHYISGLITGILSSPINNYYELYKINSQCLKYNKSILLNPFNGIMATICRDSIGNSLYFGSYYTLNDYTNSNFISGGLAGLISWTPTYWIDTIKTRIQNNTKLTYKNAFNEGNLMKGFRYCAIRSFIYNAIVFHTYELFKKYVS